MKKEEFIKKYGIEAYEKMQSQCKEWRKNNKERILKTQSEYRKTKHGKALHKISKYNELDIMHNRGKCTLTAEQLISLWEQGCYWCGEKDWHKLGADRIDNSKPHTFENCVCACKKCNDKRNRKSFDEYKKIVGLG